MKRTDNLWLFFAVITIIGLTITTCKEDDTHTHSWRDWVVTDLATCVSAGSQERICNDCGERQSEAITVNFDAHNLLPTANTLKAASCTEEGFGELACTRSGCGFTEAGGVIPMLDHDWEYAPGATEPTCTEPGSGERNCENCPATSIGGAFPELGHKWIDNWGVKTDASCIADGENIRVCDRDNCIEEQTHIVEMLEHEWINNWAHTTTVTCISNGEDTRICFRDGCTADEKRIVPALNHVWLDNSWKETTSATCTAEGEDTRFCDRDNCEVKQTRKADKLEHAWIYNSNAVPPTCTAQGSGLRTCPDCPATSPGGTYPALGHDYADWTAPTCTVAGNSSRNCVRFAVCGNTNTRSTGYAALGHIDGNWTQTTLPACTTEGAMTGSCVRGGCHDAAYKPVMKGDAALGHVWIENWGVKTTPTCTAAGVDERICNRQGCSNNETRPIAMLGHAPGNWVQTTLPACTTDGIETGTCTRVGCVQPNTPRKGQDRLGHAPGNWVQTTLPTCTEDGIETGTCTRVGCVQPNTPRKGQDRLGHAPGNWVQTTLPTCTEDGIETGTCTRVGCNQANTPRKGQDKLNHNFSATIPATCTTNSVPGTCSRTNCNTTNPEAVVKALGHNWGNWTSTSTIGTITNLSAGIQMTRNCSRNLSGIACIQTENGTLSEYISTQAEPVPLKISINLGEMGTANNGWTQLLSVLAKANKKVVMDLSDSTVTGTNFNTGVTTSTKPQGMNTIISIVLPSGVTSIGVQAFRGCSSLTSITIPNSVTSIGRSAFWGCSSLTSVTIPSSVTSIGDSIGNSAFADCSSLTSINVEWNNQDYSSQNGVLYNKSMTVILAVPAGISGSITIPDSVTSIYDSAFVGSGLTSVTIPNSVTSIGDWAFYDCSSLTSITIGNSVTSIGHNAFWGCSSLTSVTIPNSVTSIGSSAFSGCSSLTSVNVEGNNLSYSSQNGVLYNKSKTIILVVPAGISRSITIPNSVTYIYIRAFSGCTGLTSITIPNSVTSIGSWAFSGCTGLTSVTIGNSVTSISDYAFYDCISLTSVTFMGTITADNFSSYSIPGNLISKYLAGGIGTYTRPAESNTWTKM